MLSPSPDRPQWSALPYTVRLPGQLLADTSAAHHLLGQCALVRNRDNRGVRHYRAILPPHPVRRNIFLT